MRLPLLILYFLAGLSLVLFQNCTDPKVVLSRLSSEPPANKMSLQASICSEISYLQDENTNFLFVLDMSRSNIGQFREEMVTEGGWEFLEYYWDPTQGTDLEGARFDAVRTFIDSCASSENNKFAVVGFAQKAGEIMTDPRGRPFLNCAEPTPFKSRDEVFTDINRLQAAENSEAEYYSQWIDEYYDEDPDHVSVAMAYTSYSDAADCASQTINKDLIESYDEQVDRYQVIFISDGRPIDSEDSISACYEKDAAEQDQCYIDFLLNPFNDSLREVSSIRRNINFLTIGYGIEDQSDFRFLDALASIEREGSAEALDSFADNSAVLCEMISSRIGVETQSDSLMATVLTLSQRSGEYIVDSDMDGVFDIDEIALGYDPSHPRSQVTGVLDGVCELTGGIAACHAIREQVECDENDLSMTGFSDCDIKVIKEHKSSLNLDDSVDWDKDGVPNFIEVVKGTDPFIDDMSDDPDNDGLTTRYEIMRSKNPFEHEKMTSLDLDQVIINNEILADVDYCPTRARHLVLEQVPAIPTERVSTGVSAPMSHLDNEHVVAIFSSRKTQNFTLEDRGMVGKFVKLGYDDSLENNPFLVPVFNQVFSDDMEVWER